MVTVCVCEKGRRRSQVERTAVTIKPFGRLLTQKFSIALWGVGIPYMSGTDTMGE
jgi:hypothetical protein